MLRGWQSQQVANIIKLVMTTGSIIIVGVGGVGGGGVDRIRSYDRIIATRRACGHHHEDRVVMMVRGGGPGKASIHMVMVGRGFGCGPNEVVELEPGPATRPRCGRDVKVIGVCVGGCVVAMEAWRRRHGGACEDKVREGQFMLAP
mgnify:CR=1 FL=1